MEILKYCQNGEFKKLKTLLSKKDSEVDINQTDSDGDTPLILATMIGNLECIQLLLKKGADKELTNKVSEDLSLIVKGDDIC